MRQQMHLAMFIHGDCKAVCALLAEPVVFDMHLATRWRRGVRGILRRLAIVMEVDAKEAAFLEVSKGGRTFRVQAFG